MTTTPAAHLPRIIMFLGVTDAGEYGATTCPHCDAKGRYVYSFLCEDGVRRGAMAGCIKKFPVSKLADEHRKIIDRQRERVATGGKLASWDERKLEAINKVAAGELTLDDALLVITAENSKRADWMSKKHGGRRY